MSIMDECIRRINAEIIRTERFPDSAGKRSRLAELKAMLQEYEQAEPDESSGVLK